MKKLLTFITLLTSLYSADAFITAEDLNEKLHNDNLVIIDVGTKTDYLKSHLPHAVQTDMKAWRKKVAKHKEIRSSKELLKEIQRLGINNDSHVVIYGHNKPKEALKSSYVAMALIQQGLKEVSILDGAYEEWSYDDELPLSSGPYLPSPGNFKPNPNNNIVVDLNYVFDHIKKVPMLEARPSEFYYGTYRSQGVNRIGHIPGAMSSNWKDKFQRDGLLKTDKALDEIFYTGFELKQDKEIILYCTGGLEASMNWFIVSQKMKFKNAKIYDASMREWGNLNDTPITRYKWEVYYK